jgi:hypothetical protein
VFLVRVTVCRAQASQLAALAGAQLQEAAEERQRLAAGRAALEQLERQEEAAAAGGQVRPVMAFCNEMLSLTLSSGFALLLSYSESPQFVKIAVAEGNIAVLQIYCPVPMTSLVQEAAELASRLAAAMDAKQLLESRVHLLESELEDARSALEEGRQLLAAQSAALANDLQAARSAATRVGGGEVVGMFVAYSCAGGWGALPSWGTACPLRPARPPRLPRWSP